MLVLFFGIASVGTMVWAISSLMATEAAAEKRRLGRLQT